MSWVIKDRPSDPHYLTSTGDVLRGLKNAQRFEHYFDAVAAYVKNNLCSSRIVRLKPRLVCPMCGAKK